MSDSPETTRSNRGTMMDRAGNQLTPSEAAGARLRARLVLALAEVEALEAAGESFGTDMHDFTDADYMDMV